MIPFIYCPMCRTELLAKRIPDDGPERRICPSCKFIQWGNSKPTAAGVVLNEEGLVLLGRRVIEPFYGWWDIPGGFLEPAESPEAGLRREVLEETGLHVTDLKLIGVFMDVYGDPATEGPYEDLINFYYECRMVPGEAATAADDIDALKWFAPDDLLVEQVAFASNRAALTEWLRQRDRTNGF